MPARLNRRRYREVVALLKEVVADPKAPQQRRLRAAETLLGVFDRHDRNEARKAQRRAADTSEQPVPETEAESLEGLLKRMKSEREGEE